MSSRRRNVNTKMSNQAATQAEPLIPHAIPPYHDISDSPPPSPSASQFSKFTPLSLSNTPAWLPIAAASGACAAFNGVFAKLTTTSLTSSWASKLSLAFHLAEDNKIVAFLLRAFFFSLNLAFNALMWTLFTMALTRAASTTRVSLINTSFNFLLTALSGWLVFGEKLPLLWWVGAMGLVVGNVVIGRRDSGETDDKRTEEAVKLQDDMGDRSEESQQRYRDEAEERPPAQELP